MSAVVGAQAVTRQTGDPGLSGISLPILPRIKVNDAPPVVVHGFELIRQQSSPDIDGTLLLYYHQKTGVQVFIVKNSDPEICAGVGYYTPPVSPRGEPHCGEHWLFRGSDLYRLREPFVQFEKSATVEGNAYVTYDFTAYHHSGQDEDELIEYWKRILDAHRKPLLRNSAFREEIWRLEQIQDADGQQRWGLVAIVLDEQKLNFANPLLCFDRAIVSGLFPDTHLRFDSGGDPRAIPDLTAQELRDYVRRYTVPANSKYIICGNVNVELHLRVIDEVLSTYEDIGEAELRRPHQLPFSEPRYFEGYYPGGVREDAARDTIVGLAYRIGSKHCPKKNLKLTILGEILLGDACGLLTQALQQAEFGEDIITEGVSLDLYEAVFSVGVLGADEKSADEIENHILETLEAMSREGIPPQVVQKAIDRVERDLRETANSENANLALFEHSMCAWQHNIDPFAVQHSIEHIRLIKEELNNNPGLFTELLKQVLVHNNDRIRVVLKPKRSQIAEWDEEEAARVATLTAEENAGQSFQLVSAGIDDSEDRIDEHSYRLTNKGLRSTNRPLPPRNDHLDRTVCFEQAAHGFTYASVGISFRNIKLELVPWVGLLSDLYFQVGSLRKSPVALLEKIRQVGRCTCNLFHSPHLNGQTTEARLLVEAAAYTEDMVALADLMHKGIQYANLEDRKRILRLAIQRKSSLEQAMADEGTAFAMDRAAHQLHPSAYVHDYTSGIGYLQFLREVIGNMRRNWSEVKALLMQVHSMILEHADTRVSFSATAQDLDVILPQIGDLAQRFGKNRNGQHAWDVPCNRAAEGFSIPGQVNFVSQAFNLKEAGYTQYDAGIGTTLTHLHSTYLWNRVRRQIGAYGVEIDYQPLTGILSLGSRRDIQIIQTLEVFKRIPQWLRSRAVTPDDLGRSRGGAVRKINPKLSVEQKAQAGFQDWLTGISPSYRETELDQIFAEEEILHAHALRFADALEAAIESKARIAILGAQSALEQANRERGGEWLEIVSLE